MTIEFFDTKTQGLTALNPVIPGKVGIYVCGPTVQSEPHLGHLRSALSYDVMRRWLEYRGLSVTLVRNVTDIDDKILANSAKTGEPWWALAYRIEREFNAAYDLLHILPPTYEPRATANIDRMITVITQLIERGHAYQATDGSANVYFDTASWPSYGELTHQRAGEMVDDAEGAAAGKRSPRDFALWKAHKADEPETAAWDSPWGAGRPGWHIECSAMSTRYLGTQFDIHGGGLDLRFPHHENELAQSRAAGYEFANIWVHNGLIAVGDQKMSKSLGNFILAADLLSASPAQHIRYLFTATHYRSTLTYSEKALTEAGVAIERVNAFIARAREVLNEPAELAEARKHTTGAIPADFAAAMDADLGTPQAFSVLFDTVREGNSALDKNALPELETALAAVESMLQVLGLHPDDYNNQTGEDDKLYRALDALVQGQLQARAQARAARDYQTADQIRDQFTAAGISIEDTPDGAKWSING